MTAPAEGVRVELTLGGRERLERFASLLEFVRHGKVVVDWREEPDPDGDPDEEGPPIPVYDETDRSGDDLYTLAQVLELCQWFDWAVTDDGRIVVSLMYDQPGLLDEALAQTAVPARRA